MAFWGKKVSGVYKPKKSEKKQEEESGQKLRKAQQLFTAAKAKYDTSIMDERELLYLGSRDIDPNVNNSKSPVSGRKKANNVVNIIFEFVESQIDTTIPQPVVQSKRKQDALAQIIEDSIKNDLMESDIFRINDENERTTPIQGLSIITVDWNPDFKHHLYRGEILLDNRHPKAFIPQPGVYDVQKMDYFFLMYSMTKDYVNRRYKVDVSEEGEQYPDINAITSNTASKLNSSLFSTTNSITSGASDQASDNVTVIVKWYKDKEGRFGKYTWVNDIELEDLPNFYARRLKRCNKCDSVMHKDECEECGNKTYKESIEEYEELTEDVQLSDGRVIPAQTPMLDEMGSPMMDMETGEPMMGPTRIKYFCPTRYPVIIRKNVPLPFNFSGQSDVDVIRDQQDAIKKVSTAIEEKIVRGGAIIKALNSHKFELTNELYKVIRGESAEINQLSVVDLQANIQQDMQFFQEQYKAAQNTLGITDSYQGKPDSTAKSGVAKQLQINQSSGRLQSKVINKRRAYKELFEIMFEFKLAFYDEIRPYLRMNEINKPEYGEFNKYEFLVQDDAGEWYYDTDFLFTADAGDGIPKDKMWLMNQAYLFAQATLMDKAQFWMIMEKLGYPGAGDIKMQADAEKQMAMQQQQMAEQQQLMQQLYSTAYNEAYGQTGGIQQTMPQGEGGEEA